MTFGTSTEFIGFLPPPGDAISNYNRTIHHDEQSSAVPAAFKEAMSVREEVFVKDQGVPLENELDGDDARSFHWIVYASVGTSTSSPPASLPKATTQPESAGHSRKTSRDLNEERRNSGSTASRVAVGTIRLVPPPHTSHDSTTPSGGNEYPQFEPSEPYIKLGRLATLPPYRNIGLSKLLVNAALEWATHHPKEVVKPLSPAEEEARKLGHGEEQQQWKGLVLVHAQAQVEGFWARYGFVRSAEMGTWIEEGIEHIGMAKRIEVKGIDFGQTIRLPGMPMEQSSATY